MFKSFFVDFFCYKESHFQFYHFFYIKIQKTLQPFSILNRPCVLLLDVLQFLIIAFLQIPLYKHTARSSHRRCSVSCYTCVGGNSDKGFFL